MSSFIINSNRCLMLAKRLESVARALLVIIGVWIPVLNALICVFILVFGSPSFLWDFWFKIRGIWHP